ncbi:MAG: hypothetical protein L0I76_05370 [Pseudonocardia sp.]|nr:hypothetical protein [Pseudonocardia sp.]
MYAGFDRARELAGADDLVVPGHDPEVFARFPQVPGIPAVRIASGGPDQPGSLGFVASERSVSRPGAGRTEP